MVFLPGSALDGVLCAFDAQRQVFAITGADGRIKVFDASSGSLKVEFGSSVAGSKQLIDNFTSMCWGARALTQAAQKSLSGETHILAVGMITGDVAAFDLATGALAWRTPSAIPGVVGGITFDVASKCFVAAGKDGTVAVLDVASGKKTFSGAVTGHSLTAAEALQSGTQCIVAGSYLHLINTKDASVECKMSGHSTAVSALGVTPDGSYVLSGAQGDRSIAIFSLARKTSTKPKVRKAKGHLSVEDAPVSLHCCACDTDGSCRKDFFALALTEAGEVYVWKCSKVDGNVSGALKARISVGTAVQRGAKSGAQQTLLSAAFEGPNAVLVARGHAAKPDFELVRLSSKDDQKISLAVSTTGLLMRQPQEEKAPTAKPQAMTVGPENVGASIQRGELAGSRKRAQPEAASSTEDEFSIPVASEQPLGERVAALTGPDGAAETQAPPSATNAPITADSLSVLLTQALRAEDKTLLEKVLTTGNQAVIRNTIARLAPTDAALFLKAAVDRLQTKPARASQLVPWLRATILAHTSYLSTAPGIQPHLTAVYQLIEARLSVFQPMLALRGRLDVVLSQRSGQYVQAAMEQAGPLISVDLADQLHVIEDPYAVQGDSDDDMDEGWVSASDDEGEEGGPSSGNESMSEDDS